MLENPSNKPLFGSVSVAILVLAALVIVLAGLKAAQTLIVPFLLACFIAIILLGPLNWLEGRGIKPWASYVIVLTGLLLIILLLSSLVGNSFDQFRTALPEYRERLSTDLQVLTKLTEKLGVETTEGSMAASLSPARIMQFTSDILGNFATLVANGFLILLTVAFILAEIKCFPAKLLNSISEPEKMLNKIRTFTDSANSYMVTKAAVSALTGSLVAIALAILGVDFPVLWGVLAFFLNFVPNIGSIFAAIPAIMVAYLELGPGIAVATIIVYVAINVIVGNLIEPRFMGKSVGLSTLVVFLSLVFWGFILGPVGMLLSVPLTMMVKIALSENKETAWISLLLGQNPSNEPSR